MQYFPYDIKQITHLREENDVNLKEIDVIEEETHILDELNENIYGGFIANDEMWDVNAVMLQEDENEVKEKREEVNTMILGEMQMIVELVESFLYDLVTDNEAWYENEMDEGTEVIVR